jgi:hypothetical protein|tara:strand:- start:713 stop:877 length:165 start_codon:yes stop_codon:yes gene_type:complete
MMIKICAKCNALHRDDEPCVTRSLAEILAEMERVTRQRTATPEWVKRQLQNKNG